jgi:RES domain-containing protein
MRVWRICKAELAATAFTGEGAILYGGRWHHAGTPVVYCSESRALAALEQLVHLHRNRLPSNFVCFGVDIPDGLAIREVRREELPADWRRQPGPSELRDVGTRWAESGETVVLQVPSAVVPEEHNFLLNPRHPEFVRLTISGSEPFAFDERLVEPSRDAGAQRDGVNREGTQETTWSREQTRTSRYSGAAHPGSGSC